MDGASPGDAAQKLLANVQPTSLGSASLRKALRSVQSCWTVPAEVQAPARTGTYQLPRHNHRLHKRGINKESWPLLASGSARLGGLYVRSRHGATYT